ncbi:MAG: metallophosphoesterase [Fibrobacteria bacterium]|nr:metallophosphoesterase [Fibrobacteria bacterium]
MNSTDTHSTKILWASKKKDGDVKVVVFSGTTPIGEYNTTVIRIPAKKKYIYTTTVTGLRPDSRYRYVVYFQGETKRGYFRTLPQVGMPMHFTIFGDNRSHPDIFRGVSKAISWEKSSLAISTGDFCVNGNKLGSWRKQFFMPGDDLISFTTLWPVRGNHDGISSIYSAIFDLPGEELYYSFTASDVHFVILDLKLKKRKEQMLLWLENDLRRSKSIWTIVLYHYPTFNAGGHGSDWGREDVYPILKKGDVDMVITGHSHIYERFLPIGAPGDKPIIFITTGGAGAPIHKAIENEALVSGRGYAETHYCQFYSHADTLAMKAKTPAGMVIDDFRLIKKNGFYQQEIMGQVISVEEAQKRLESN